MAVQTIVERLSGTHEEGTWPVFVYDDASGELTKATAIAAARLLIENPPWDVITTGLSYEELGPHSARVVFTGGTEIGGSLPTGGPSWDLGGVVTSFSYQLQGRKFTQAISNHALLPAPGVATFPPFVNVQHSYGKSEPIGMDVSAPPATFNVVYRFPGFFISDAYRATIASCCGKLNSSPYIGAGAGELLLVSVTGGGSSNRMQQVTFGFAESKTENVAMGALGNLEVPPHGIHWSNTRPKMTTFGSHSIEYPEFVFAASQNVWPSAPYAGLLGE